MTKKQKCQSDYIHHCFQREELLAKIICWDAVIEQKRQGVAVEL
jgi:hypothetical protein